MAFHEVRFPTDISYGEVGGPGWSTTVDILESGAEGRNQNWASERGRWELIRNNWTQAKINEVLAFFNARAGRLHGFRFKAVANYRTTSPYDYLGTATATPQTVWQLRKQFISGSTTYNKTIKKPVAGTTRVYFGSVEQVTGWTVSTTAGTITFGTGPPNGTVVNAYCEFDVPVRFDTDNLQIISVAAGVFSLPSLPLVELRV